MRGQRRPGLRHRHFQLSGAATQGGQCGGSGDYTGGITSGTVEVPVNDSTEVTFTANDDDEVEPTEDVRVTIQPGDYNVWSYRESAGVNIQDDDVNIAVESGTCELQLLGGDPADVVVTDYYGSPKSGVPLEIDYYDASILAVEWSASGSTTDANGQATLMVGGIGEGNSPLRVRQMAKSGYGEGHWFTVPPNLILPKTFTVRKAQTLTMEIMVRGGLRNQGIPGAKLEGRMPPGSGGFMVTPNWRYQNGTTDADGRCLVDVTGILAGGGGDYEFKAILPGWNGAEIIKRVKIIVEP